MLVISITASYLFFTLASYLQLLLVEKLTLVFFPSRLGWIIRFISHSVISGFTSASAIVIALSQAKYFLGYDIVRSSEIIPLIKSIISGADEVCFPCQVTDPDEYLC